MQKNFNKGDDKQKKKTDLGMEPGTIGVICAADFFEHPTTTIYMETT